MGKRHLTPMEIKAQCKAVAREKRMAERTPWTAMSILLSYVIMKKEGFKGQRILRITNRVEQMEEEFSSGSMDLQKVSDAFFEKLGYPIGYEEYTEEDITFKKGSFDYWITQKQIDPQNRINKFSTRYIIFFFTALMQEYGYGTERLNRVINYMNELLELYQKDKTTVYEWKVALYEEAGVVVEMPIDPLTQTSGSMLTGVY